MYQNAILKEDSIDDETNIVNNENQSIDRLEIREEFCKTNESMTIRQSIRVQYRNCANIKSCNRKKDCDDRI